MHIESLKVMKYFVDNYLDKHKNLEILEVGSYDVNGTYRALFDSPNWKYTGLDIEAGPNVDVVSKSNYEFGLDKQYDVIVSGNCIEHVESPQQWIGEIERSLKPGGITCIVTPFMIPEHRFPVDCWRILPDGFKYLMEKEAGFNILETKIHYHEKRYKILRLIPLPATLMNIFPVKIGSFFEYLDKQSIDDTYVIALKK